MIKKVKGDFPDFDSNLNQIKKTLPPILANTAKNHFIDGFKTGGGKTDQSIGGWRKRKTSGSRRDQMRPILVKTADLRSDIKKLFISFRKIVIGSQNVNYASYINEGTEKMPQREFIGKSRYLERKLARIIGMTFKKTLK